MPASVIRKLSWSSTSVNASMCQQLHDGVRNVAAKATCVRRRQRCACPWKHHLPTADATLVERQHLGDFCGVPLVATLLEPLRMRHLRRGEQIVDRDLPKAGGGRHRSASVSVQSSTWCPS
jgi:hypothetical protein